MQERKRDHHLLDCDPQQDSADHRIATVQGDSRQVRKFVFLQAPTNLQLIILIPFTYLDLISFVTNVYHP